jgi:DNA (cytosine-5)-methyltransferase 1
MIRNLLRKGYQVRVCRLNAMDYGDPQNRARIIVFAAQNGIPMPNVPAPTHGDGSLQPRLTIREAIGGLVDAREYDPNVHGRIPNMEFRETSIDLERDNDEDAVLEADSQANVIRASPGKIPIHYKRERLISVREAALIQSFPLRYKFHGDIHSQYKQVGNAVPVGLATAIARSVHDALQRIWEPRDAE